MDDLDPTVADRILGEYPELLDHWRRENRGSWRMHDPTYLREVVRQHRLLIDGTSRPDPKLACRCEEIVATFPPVREHRERLLTDAWFRARLAPQQVTKLYDPEYLQRWVKIRKEGADPFSERSLRFRRLMDAMSAGGVLTAIDIATNEVLDQWEVDPQPGDRPMN